jgi:hypothetical protein
MISRRTTVISATRSAVITTRDPRHFRRAVHCRFPPAGRVTTVAIHARPAFRRINPLEVPGLSYSHDRKVIRPCCRFR